MTTANPRPEWIKDGVRVLYRVSPGPEYEYAGTVDGEPFLLGGHTWCVRLRDMEKRYRDGTRSTVNAAACQGLRPMCLNAPSASLPGRCEQCGERFTSAPIISGPKDRFLCIDCASKEEQPEDAPRPPPLPPLPGTHGELQLLHELERRFRLLRVDASLADALADAEPLLQDLDLLRSRRKATPSAAEATQDDSGERWGWAATRETESWQGAFRTREQAIAAARAELGAGAEVWVQSGAIVETTRFLPTAQFFEQEMYERAVDDSFPDHLDDPFIFAPGSRGALDDALIAWCEKYVTANWWEPVGEPERVAPEGEATP